MRSFRKRQLIFPTLTFALFFFILFKNQSKNFEDKERNLNTAQSIKQKSSKSVESFWNNVSISNKSEHTRHRRRISPRQSKISFDHLKDVVSWPSELANFDFSGCRMSNCFDFSRCRAQSPIKVYIAPPEGNLNTNSTAFGESNIIYKKILSVVRASKYYVNRAEDACIFIREDDTLDRDTLSKSIRRDLMDLLIDKYQYGMNHLVFNLYSGTWPNYKDDDFAGLRFGAAILAKASNSEKSHRPGFDISLPLFSYLHGSSNNSLEVKSDRNRTYFLSFKGKRYVQGSGAMVRDRLRHIDNNRDIVILTTCRHGRNWFESKDDRCSEDDANYELHDFNELMKDSIFCLTPRGRRLGSFRFLEALNVECIPVVLSDGWTWPFDEIIDWSELAIQFPENLLLQVPDSLRDVERTKIEQMQRSCQLIYDRYLSSIDDIVLTTLEILDRRIRNQMRRKAIIR